MQYYAQGVSLNPLPAPPPGLAPTIEPADFQKAFVLYEGSGNNPGHGAVQWKLKRSERLARCVLEFGQTMAGHWTVSHTYPMSIKLLNAAQGGAKKDWWVTPPVTCSAGADVWLSVNLNTVAEGRGELQSATFTVGLKLGNAVFGLIHLLSGHNDAARSAGRASVARPADREDDVWQTVLLIHAGLSRFSSNNIRRILQPGDTPSKLVIVGANQGIMVIEQAVGETRYGITTLYAGSAPNHGKVVYSR